MDAPPTPTPAVRVVHGIAFRVAHRPDGILSPATLGLQEIARAAGSRQAGSWGVFPVHGQGAVVAGYLSARTPITRDHDSAIEPGGTLSSTHAVVAYARSSGGAVGNIRHDRQDGDCVEEFVEALGATDAWAALGATAHDLGALPGAEHLDEESGPAFLLLSDDGRVGEVVYGMSFWRPGSTFDEGPVQTWTRPVADGDAVRVVGVAVAQVDARSPLAVAPRTHDEATDARLRAIERETRAVLDSERRFSWYFIAGAAQPA